MDVMVNAAVVTDIDVPVMIFQAETDLTVLFSAAARPRGIATLGSM